ncbi:class I SAM-dependent methyltransferase [Sphingorhabdus sp.]|uniref:class I SAM-dependent methyltransferase n=1 Tax=Sphingorhabdus sp. TaxID=1902408 RepID=UPI003BB1970A
MNAPDTQRGRHLVAKASLPATRGGLFARLAHGAEDRFFARIIDRIDRGLEAGTIEGHLPDGSAVILGGRAPGPVAEVRLNNWRALTRLVRGGSIGWYEGWAAGDWESPDPVPVFDLFMRNRTSLGTVGRASGVAKLAGKVAHWFNRNNKAKARENIAAHYDLGNDFYAAWLDPTMTYSSAVFESGDDLEAAQHRKIGLILDRLNMKPGDNLLEIGCGWGGLAEAALARSAIHYHGITLSPEQKAYADARLSGKPGWAITLTDYRDVTGQYDAIASVEMVVSVGMEYWPSYLDCIARNLTPGGRAALQYIRIEDDIFESYADGADFIQRYIFPGGMLLSESRFRALAEARGLTWCDQQDYGLHYAETLRLWRERFDAAVEQGRLPSGFDAKFVALWRYYLMYCEGGFRGGGINVAQVTLQKDADTSTVALSLSKGASQ